MNYKVVLILALLFSWGNTYSQDAPCGGRDMNETHAQAIIGGATIDGFLATFQRTYNTHDLLAVADLYAEDARWFAAAGPVFEGRKALEGALEYFMTHVPPVLTLTSAETLSLGGCGASVGTYTLSGEVMNEAHTIGGAYLNVLLKEGEDWRILTQQMNYAFPMSEDMWVGQLERLAALPEAGTLETLAATYEALHNAGDALQLAELFTADAKVSLAGQPLVAGRADLRRHLQDALGQSLQLDLHELRTLGLGDGVAVDVGWYELTQETEQVRWGTYSALVRKSAGGEWQVHWLVTTASPPRAVR